MPRYDTCLICGQIKRSISKTCKNCQKQKQNRNFKPQINYELLSDEWTSEFRGLFWGEGSAMIIRNNASFGPCLCVRLRDDDLPIILDIQEKLGGRLLRSNRHIINPNHGNMIEWRATNRVHVKEICELLLQAKLPAKKINDVRQVLDFCNWRSSIGHFLTDSDRTEAERRLHVLKVSRFYHLI